MLGSTTVVVPPSYIDRSGVLWIRYEYDIGFINLAFQRLGAAIFVAGSDLRAMARTSRFRLASVSMAALWASPIQNAGSGRGPVLYTLAADRTSATYEQYDLGTFYLTSSVFLRRVGCSGMPGSGQHQHAVPPTFQPRRELQPEIQLQPGDYLKMIATWQESVNFDVFTVAVGLVPV